MAAASSRIHLDDERLRVTSWAFEDGDETGHHRHAYDYLVVPVTGGSFAVTDAGGATSERVQEAGVPYRGSAGAEHNVTNASGRTAVFVEIELKR